MIFLVKILVIWNRRKLYMILSLNSFSINIGWLYSVSIFLIMDFHKPFDDSNYFILCHDAHVSFFDVNLFVECIEFCISVLNWIALHFKRLVDNLCYLLLTVYNRHMDRLMIVEPFFFPQLIDPFFNIKALSLSHVCANYLVTISDYLWLL